MQVYILHKANKGCLRSSYLPWIPRSWIHLSEVLADRQLVQGLAGESQSAAGAADECQF